MVKHSTAQDVIGQQMTESSIALNTEAVTNEFDRQISDGFHSVYFFNGTTVGSIDLATFLI